MTEPSSLLSRWNLLPAHRPAVVQAIAKALAAHHYPARSLEEALSPNVQLWMRLLPEAEIAAEAAFKSLDGLSVPSETKDTRMAVPVREILWALEREAPNTEDSPQWRAASELRKITQWETRTLICEVGNQSIETMKVKP